MEDTMSLMIYLSLMLPVPAGFMHALSNQCEYREAGRNTIISIVKEVPNDINGRILCLGLSTTTFRLLAQLCGTRRYSLTALGISNSCLYRLIPASFRGMVFILLEIMIFQDSLV